tara:strand:- start:338 stop:541 length:204 start_codon:yes stop_codon:yes gene_type:complete
MEGLVKRQMTELAKKLKGHQYYGGTLLGLAEYDLQIKNYKRDIYGDYAADVAAVYSQYIYLAKKVGE